MFSQFDTLHTLTVLSVDPDTKYLPSREKNNTAYFTKMTC